MKQVSSFVLCIILISTASLAMAGGPPQAAYAGAPCGGQQGYAAGGNPCAYWGDAPFPGMCGGVVALPFLVVGSLLGGNTVGPYGPCGPGGAPIYKAAPVVRAPQPCGPAAGGPFGGSILTGLPCLDICAGLFGSVTGGFGLGM